MGSLESDTTGQLPFHFSLPCIGEGNVKALEEVSQIPSRDILLGRLFGSMQSPVANLARVIQQIADKDGEGAAAAEA